MAEDCLGKKIAYDKVVSPPSPEANQRHIIRPPSNTWAVPDSVQSPSVSPEFQAP